MNQPNPATGRLTAAPSGCTCLRLRKAARRVSQIYDHALAPYNLTVTQYGLLGHIRTLDGVGIGALADELAMDPTTLTRNLRPLEARKLVVAVPDVRDRRNRNLHLTEAGRAALSAARPGWDAAQKKIAALLGERDGPQLATIVDSLITKLAAA
jgi:DNA-binding MarR family transcriptional regulator